MTVCGTLVKNAGQSQFDILNNKMRIAELTETIALETGARVIKNPTNNGLVSFLLRSQDKSLRGLTYGADVYWWDAAAAIHGDIAKELGYQDYIDDRLHLTYKRHYDEIRFDAPEKWTLNTIMNHPQLKKLLNDNRILFYADGDGWVNGNEWRDLLDKYPHEIH